MTYLRGGWSWARSASSPGQQDERMWPSAAVQKVRVGYGEEFPHRDRD